MFKKVKKMLGIEGVKINLHIHQPILIENKILKGTVKLHSLMDQKVKSIKIELIEKYSRGRKDNLLVNEYVLGRVVLEEEMMIKKDEMVELDFELPFVFGKSEMDQLADSNFIFRRFVKLAKYIKKVKSNYKVQAEAIVIGTKLHPIASIDVDLK